MSDLGSLGRRGDRLMVLIAITALLGLLYLLVRTVWRAFTGYYARATGTRRRKTKQRRKTNAT